MPGMTTPSASTYAFTAHCTAGGHIRVRVAPARRQREDSAGIVAQATWATPLPVMPGYRGPQAPASSAQINQRCILAARRTKKSISARKHQRQNGGSARGYQELVLPLADPNSSRPGKRPDRIFMRH
jgi:hypothetical protein